MDTKGYRNEAPSSLNNREGSIQSIDDLNS